MMDESVLAAAADIVASLAAGNSTASSPTDPAGRQIALPGSETQAKRHLEAELQKLAIRVRHLESRASVATLPTLPQTPNELSDTLFGSSSVCSPAAASKQGSQCVGQGAAAAAESPPLKRRRLDPDALDALQEHVTDQSKLLDTQRQEITGLNAQLVTQTRLQQGALDILEHKSVATLERELLKHQKANEAFQKVLREIGQIVTAVARGDLTMKVRMNAVELDPEITTFKRTINAMMDQLQTFASEVSRVAREVGTEGLLGGQAVIGGIDGTWKELTDNGIVPCAMFNVPDS